MAALNCQRQGDHSYYNEQYKQNNVYNDIPRNGQRGGIYNDISRLNLWCWLINNGVSRDEIHRKPTAYATESRSRHQTPPEFKLKRFVAVR